MPVADKPIALTRAIRSQWQSFWSNRPEENPMDLVSTLRTAEPVPASSVNRDDPGEDKQYYTHPEIPGYFFLAEENAKEVLFICLGRIRKKKPVKAVPAEEVIPDLPPLEVPDLSHRDKLAWLIKERSRCCAQIATGIGGKRRRQIDARLAQIKGLVSGLLLDNKDQPETIGHTAKKAERSRILRLLRDLMDRSTSPEWKNALWAAVDAISRQEHHKYYVDPETYEVRDGD